MGKQAIKFARAGLDQRLPRPSRVIPAEYPMVKRTALTSASASHSDNVGTSERWLSAATGIGLALQALRTRNPLGRLALATAGLSLLTRSATGYCALKGTLGGDTTLKQGLQEQLRRMRATVVSHTVRTLESMDALYATELQELHSAECQLGNVIEGLIGSIRNEPLALRLDEYVTELRARRVDLESLLARIDVDARPHPDDAMRALLEETQKMVQVCAPALKDAAVAASIQRIIHYKIAGYGTIAAYAKALGRTEEAGHFAELADRDKAIDSEFSKLAKSTLNPQATSSSVSDESSLGSVRTH
jgi:ferritin-like metal-binding protein YciE